MTLWLGRNGFGDAPTSAIVRASERIWAGVRMPPGYPEPMASSLRVACVQLNATESKADNIERAERLVAKAAATGADLVLLPEKWNGFGRPDFMRSIAESLDDGETFAAMSDWARAHGITLVGGSIVERRDGREKLSNTCAVFDPEGETAAVYRKIHMFDVDVGGHVYRESETEEPGDPLEGCEVATVPAAFTLYTGKDHWELLLRARAVENQCYVVAANQWGSFAEGKAAYGRSSIVDPWGVVLAQAPDEDTVISAELDRGHLEDIRRRLPSLANRQPEAYHWRTEV